jgi:hypothetical protein
LLEMRAMAVGFEEFKDQYYEDLILGRLSIVYKADNELPMQYSC